ncbi:MAG TPA: hypothetical protein VJA19_14720 [Pseudomonas sp.]|nr:hypothetical protein [Pseudomonas sp.]
MDSNLHSASALSRAALSAAHRVLRRGASLFLLLTLPCTAASAGEAIWPLACAGFCAQPVAWQPGPSVGGGLRFKDETQWVLLMEQPSAHMQRADQWLLRHDYQAAAHDLHRASAYLDLAAGNAELRQQAALQACALELAGVADLLTGTAGGELDDLPSLSVVFARAESAIAADHQARAAQALDRDEPQSAGHFLSASIQHLENAVSWTGQAFVDPTATQAQAQALRLLAARMIEGQEEAIRQAGGGVAWVGGEVQRLQQAIEASVLPGVLVPPPGRLRF